MLQGTREVDLRCNMHEANGIIADGNLNKLMANDLLLIFTLFTIKLSWSSLFYHLTGKNIISLSVFLMN